MAEWLDSRKSFTKVLRNHEIAELEQINTDSGRYYKTPAGALYPSATTVVGFLGKEAIEKWKKRVGVEEAERISNKAATRGTRMHTLCEDYINGDPINPSEYDWNDQFQFKMLRRHLDAYVDNVHMQEVRLYSDYLKLAGTVDLVAEYNGRLSIIDFKTSKKLKEEKWILNYFCQATAYAIMYEEITGIPVPQIVIMIMVDDEEPQIFVKKRNDYVKDLLDIREKYRLTYNV
jgi:genome maintenance exonuclease 1